MRKLIPLCVLPLLGAVTIASAGLVGASPCGSSTAPLGKYLTSVVEKMTVEGDTETQHILEFKSLSPVAWVSEEATCEKILATVDKEWPSPRGGPVYVMQVGTDYAVIQGDEKSSANVTVQHVDAAFTFVAAIIWQ